MITLHAELKKRSLQIRTLLQVHDELVLEAPETEVNEAVQLTRKVMAGAYKLRASLKIHS